MLVCATLPRSGEFLKIQRDLKLREQRVPNKERNRRGRNVIKNVKGVVFSPVWKSIRCARPQCCVDATEFRRWSPCNSRFISRWPFSIPHHDFHASTRNPIHHHINPPRSRRVDFPVRGAGSRNFIVSGDRVDEVNKTRVSVNTVSGETGVHEGNYSYRSVDRRNRNDERVP